MANVDVFRSHCQNFCIVSAAIIIVYLVVNRLWTRWKEAHQASGGSLPTGPLWRLLGLFPYFILLFIAVPFSILIVCWLFGLPLALAEKWSAWIGFDYLIGNTLGLMDPITNDIPETHTGLIVAVVLNLGCWIMATILLSLLSLVPLVSRISERIPPTVCGYLGFILVAIPLVLLAITAIFAAAISFAEGWSYKDGFLFMISSLLGVANPLTSVTPDQGHGTFCEIFCVSVQLAISGVILGTSADHPIITRLFALCHGRGSITLLKRRADTIKSLDVTASVSQERDTGAAPEEREGEAEDSATKVDIDPVCTSVQIEESGMQDKEENELAFRTVMTFIDTIGQRELSHYEGIKL